MQERRIEMAVDKLPYIINVVPFRFNDEVRYTVTVNGGDEILFIWDNSVGHYAAVGDESATLPDSVELAIAEKLQSLLKKDYVA